ncbi:hypothetical protein WA556_003393 [Blastocystis sp. ATCC 50177/Nand II]
MTQAIWYLKENIKYDGIRSFAPEVFTGDYACLFELARVEPYHGECRVNSPEGISISSFPFKAIAGVSEVFVDYVKKCLVKDVNERWSVSELMDHPFVKESVERIRKDGYSEGLKRLARIVQSQQASESVIKQVEDSA